jgi:rhomboid family GlyGly-CTERM serine protease
MTVASRLSALRDGLAAVHICGSTGVWLTALLAALLLPEWLGGAGLREALRYERAALEAGTLWRAISGQFVHLDGGHALANAAGAILIWALVGPAFRVAGWTLTLLVSLLGTAAGLWWCATDVAWYVGGSGFLHGLLAAGAVRLALGGDALARIVVAVLCVKLAWEQWVGPLGAAGTAVTPPVVVAAHLSGAVSGTLVGALAAAVSNRRRRL